MKGSRAPSNTAASIFFIMKKFRKDRKKWETIKKELYKKCVTLVSDDPDEQKQMQMVYDYQDGLYETPKVYDKDGYAYNDGTWIKFKTGCMYRKKYRGMMMCGNKKSLIDCLDAYMCFLKKMGVDDGRVFNYFTVVYMLDKLDFKDGMFPANRDNTNILAGLICNVMDKDVADISCGCEDERRYCMDPRTKSKDRKVWTSVQRKKDKELDWKRIEELYDSSKTDVQNLMEFRKKGLVISKGTLQNWKRYKKLSND